MQTNVVFTENPGRTDNQGVIRIASSSYACCTLPTPVHSRNATAKIAPIPRIPRDTRILMHLRGPEIAEDDVEMIANLNVMRFPGSTRAESSPEASCCFGNLTGGGPVRSPASSHSTSFEGTHHAPVTGPHHARRTRTVFGGTGITGNAVAASITQTVVV